MKVLVIGANGNTATRVVKQLKDGPHDPLAMIRDVNSQSGIAHYHKAKAHADNHLMASDLDYTIICPGGLRDEPGTGQTVI